MIWNTTPPPKDRRSLVKYWPRLYSNRARSWLRTTEPKIEECVYVEELATSFGWNEEKGMREMLQRMEDRWTPFSGDFGTFSTQKIKLEDIIAWMELPE